MTLPDFHDFDDPIGSNSTVGAFWRWAMSDMLGNRNRGIFAEYLVGLALGEETLQHPRLEWDCYDIAYGEYRLEVKSSAYIQTWHQDNDKRSQLSFSVGQSNCWDARQNSYDDEKKRHAHLYVFCVFPSSRDVHTRNVLDVNEWRFYVTTTKNLETCVQPHTKSIGITTVQEACGEAVQHHNLKCAIDAALASIG